MNSEVLPESESIEELDFNPACQMQLYTIYLFDYSYTPQPPCSNEAKYICTYFSCTRQEWTTIAICQECLNIAAAHKTVCSTNRCDDIPVTVKDVHPLRRT